MLWSMAQLRYCPPSVEMAACLQVSPRICTGNLEYGTLSIMVCHVNVS
jgi:hypothetical protein